MFRTAKELFPGAFDEKKAELWAGLRPMMPNSVPVIGRARYSNLYLDTGHGHVGWTMAADRENSWPTTSPAARRRSTPGVCCTRVRVLRDRPAP